MTFNLLFILFLGIIDRLRGSGRVPKAAMQILYGFTTASFLLFPVRTLTVETLYFVSSFTLLFVAGVSIGWGQPLGAYIACKPAEVDKKESWQFGVFIENSFLAVLLRGLIWAACTSPCLYFDKERTLIFMTSIFLAFPIAATITRLLVKKGYLIAWELHEIFRGLILGALVLILKQIILHWTMAQRLFLPLHKNILLFYLKHQKTLLYDLGLQKLNLHQALLGLKTPFCYLDIH